MNFSMFLTETTAGAAKSGPGSLIMTLVMVAVLGAVMYFFMYLPQKKQDKKSKYLRQERYAGSCSRSFYVGDDIAPKDVSAKFEDGILKITLPKKEQETLPENSTIAIE